MPKVSIIMATFNCENTLRRSVDSILGQTFKDWEFIICDDCSSDGTLNILREYELDYPSKFKILTNNQNSKLAFSLNRCLEIACGKYIARMDADDESNPVRLEKQVAFLEEHPEYAVVGTSMVPFDEDGFGNMRLSLPEPGPRDLLKRSCFCHATIVMRKEAYDAVGGYTVSKRTERAQDYDMWFRFFAKGFRGYNLQEGLYYVREDIAAMKRRTFKTRSYEVVTRLKGYRLLKYPLYCYPYALKPLVAALMPAGLAKRYHVKKKSRNGNNVD